MKVSALVPSPQHVDAFRRSRERFIPSQAGCYVLSTFDGTILYIGLSKDLRRRFICHLDSREKIDLTENGRAVLFHWIESTDLNKIERTWINGHIVHEGKFPVLNKIYSPVRV